MKALFDSMGKKQTEHLKRLERVMTKMAESVDRVFGQPGKVKRKTWMPEDIELDDKYARLNQKDELPEELEDDVSERKSPFLSSFWYSVLPGIAEELENARKQQQLKAELKKKFFG